MNIVALLKTLPLCGYGAIKGSASFSLLSSLFRNYR